MCNDTLPSSPVPCEPVLLRKASSVPDDHEAPKEQRPPPAKLVRGFTGSPKDDYEAQATLVASALAGWQGVDLETISVEDKSGYGGSRTFKVTAPGAEPPAVALHSRNVVEETTHETEGGCVDHDSEARQEAAAVAFAQADCAPSRLAQGGDWFIECWEGEQPWNQRDDGWDSLTDEELREAAQLLARVHNGV